MNPVDLSRFLHILREYDATAGLFSGSHDQSIPERKSVKPVKIDGGQNVADVRRGNVEFGQQFNFAASDTRINMQFSSDGDEILLQHLQRYNPGSCEPVLGDQIEGASLLCRRSLVVGIDKNVGIEEATGAHEFRFD